MDETYAATYRDKYGEERTTIHNDGKRLTMVVRGIKFIGGNFDFMAITSAADSPQLASFTFSSGFLFDYEIECDMLVKVVVRQAIQAGNLHLHLKLGEMRSGDWVVYEKLQLRFDFEGKSYWCDKRHVSFEEELIEIQKLLPEEVYIQCCFNCAFSDYNPAGSGVFGDMLCFRDNKQEYLQVQDKFDLFRVWHTVTETVQETYLCPEFEKRIPGTGYRG